MQESCCYFSTSWSVAGIVGGLDKSVYKIKRNVHIVAFNVIRNTHTANHNNNKAEHSSNVPNRYIYSYYKRKTITTIVNTVMQQSILQKVQENKSEDN